MSDNKKNSNRRRAPKEGELVHVYYNLHKYTLSIRSTDGLVIAYREEVFLEDADFRVQEAGRQKTLDTGRKNVHAKVHGYWTTERPDNCTVEVKYNPWEMGSFYKGETKEPVEEASKVIIDGSKCWIPKGEV